MNDHKVQKHQRVVLEHRVREFYQSLIERLEQAEKDLSETMIDHDYKMLQGYVGATKDICNEFAMKFIKDPKWIK